MPETLQRLLYYFIDHQRSPETNHPTEQLIPNKSITQKQLHCVQIKS